ncbi:MAG: Arm DNA-binding domain-containing protein [Alphaproteobacteria bacterium]|nr:Arm DNA-binding domain-containing protein [Alphaproteobacteria bacterium]
MTASKNKFTIKGISALKPGETVWHPRISGLGCRCQQAKKVFILKYRFHGRQRLYTIGKFGDAFTTEQAADEAMRLREMIRKDIDPAAVKKAA